MILLAGQRGIPHLTWLPNIADRFLFQDAQTDGMGVSVSCCVETFVLQCQAEYTQAVISVIKPACASPKGSRINIWPILVTTELERPL